MQPTRLPLQKNAEQKKLKPPPFSIQVSKCFGPKDYVDRESCAGERRLPVRHRTDSPCRTCRSRQLAETGKLVGREIRNNFSS